MYTVNPKFAAAIRDLSHEEKVEFCEATGIDINNMYHYCGGFKRPNPERARDMVAQFERMGYTVRKAWVRPDLWGR